MQHVSGVRVSLSEKEIETIRTRLEDVDPFNEVLEVLATPTLISSSSGQKNIYHGMAEAVSLQTFVSYTWNKR